MSAPGAAAAWAVAARVPDPELPMLTVADLGILRRVELAGDGVVEVDITPTYSGCPALEAIRADLVAALEWHGYPHARVRTVLAPPWTTDWITQRGRRLLAEHGIAPPAGRPTGAVPLPLGVACPRCGSVRTEELSRFGSTACQALWRCRDCAEPFPHVKAV